MVNTDTENSISGGIFNISGFRLMSFLNTEYDKH